MSDNLCPVCGAPKHQYGDTIKELWMEAMKLFPIYDLPIPRTCGTCLEFKLGFPVDMFYRQRRKIWLEETTPVPTLDTKDPDIYRQLKIGQRLAKEYRKLIKRQQEKMKKIHRRRSMKRAMKSFKQRDKAIREVLERAAEIL